MAAKGHARDRGTAGRSAGRGDAGSGRGAGGDAAATALVAQEASNAGSSLRLIAGAAAQLEAATSLLDVIPLRDPAKVLHGLMQRRERGSEAHAKAWALTQKIDRKIGELARELPQAKRGRKPDISPTAEVNAPSKTKQLKALGLSSADAARAERVAELDEAEFHARIEHGQARIQQGKPAAPMHATSSAVDYDGDEASTPELYAELARNALGGRIELDPACNAFAANVIKPERWFHKDDSGLDKPWVAETLFMNAPYSSELIKAFVAKLLEEYEQRNFKRAVVLVNASVETEWFQSLLGHCALVCFPHERIQFLYRGEPMRDSSNRYAQAFFYLGDQGAELFAAEFRSVGALLAPARFA